MTTIFLCLHLIWMCQASWVLNKSDYMVRIDRPIQPAYNADSNICCNGILHTHTKNEFCCGNKTYNVEKELCCDATIHTKKANEKCCSQETYNTNTHRCRLIGAPNSYGRKRHYTAELGLGPFTPKLPYIYIGTDYCGKELIYLNESSCCGGKVIAEQNIRCCAGKIYNPEEDLCCYDIKLIKKSQPNHRGCCGDESYDYKTHYCASGTLVEKPPPNKSYCGKDLFDESEKICCNDKIFSKDSGNFTYKKIIVAKQSKNHTCCCGNRSYDCLDSKYTCCDTELLDVSNDKLKCCLDSGLYNPEKDTCCQPPNSSFIYFIKMEGIKSKIHKNVLGKCCGLELYDQTKEFCCGVNVLPIGNGCCHYEINGNEAKEVEFIYSRFQFFNDHSKKEVFTA